MNPRLFHLYGPLWINSYGTMIAIGMAVFLWFTYRHPLRKNNINGDVFLNGVLVSLFFGFIGGRILFVLLNLESYSRNWVEVFYPWAGGFALLGGVLIVPPTMMIYLRRHGVARLPVFDLAALYAPLLQAVSRLGCYFAGCCYGCVASADVSWAITYCHPDSLAPLGVALHPAQLYSLGASLLIFCAVQLFYRCAKPIPGRVFFLFLILEGCARCVVEYWRGDCDQYAQSGIAYGIFNTYQLIAFVLVVIGFIGFVWLSVRASRSSSNAQNKQE